MVREPFVGEQSAPPAPGTILLVDDHRENLAALEAVLEPLGEPVIAVESGEQALRVLLHHEVAVILLDMRMAGLDGVETARRGCKLPPRWARNRGRRGATCVLPKAAVPI